MRKNSLAKQNKPNERKASFWVFLAFYALFGAFIIVQSCLPGDISSSQSELVAKAVAFFINLGSGNATAEVIEPTAIALKNGGEGDTTYLPSIGGVPQIAVGTTTRLWFDVSYPYGKIGVEDGTFDVTATKGASSFAYSVDTGNHVVRIVPSSPCEGAEIKIIAGKLSPYFYAFDAVALPVPDDYAVNFPAVSLHVNETMEVTVGPGDPSKIDMTKFLRYYDPTLLEHSSGDEAVATMDEYGNVRAVGEGSSVLRVGDKSCNLTVAGALPSPGDASLKIDKTSGEVCLLDYGEDTAKYGASFAASVSNLAEGADPSVRWWLTGNEYGLKARIVTTGEDGAGDSVCHIQGYREKGAFLVHAALRADPSVEAAIEAETSEIVPTSMSLLYATSTGEVQTFRALPSSIGVEKTTSVYLKGDFGAIAPTDSNLTVDDVEGDVLVYGENTSSLTLSFPAPGDYSLTVRSEADPSLSVSFSVAVSPVTVSPENVSFHTWVRKNIGHLGLFLCLGVFGCLFWRSFFEGSFRKEWWKFALTNLGIGFLTALTSEAIQLIPSLERGARWMDVGIDVAGFSIGFVATFLVFLAIFLIGFFKSEKRSLGEPKETKRP
ncbi:MAG: VanZ family protein [Bacilli bacterium]|jgi:hypothetical protein|nr:VanZ family protein [Bacilli bacterium]